jgi:flagellar basal body rod protein FlgG
MVAARTRLEIATENLANVSTAGFRRIAAHGFLNALGVTIARERVGDRSGEGQAGAFGRRVTGTNVANGVDAISEMIDVLAAERSFESAQKTVGAIDSTRQKSAEAARVS